ncbi:MAG: OsmC family protein [Thermoplasmata archaeon]|nr:OsmC family protein [Thermoplasmata archaeon]
MKFEPIKHYYRTQLRWTTERKGILRCEDKPDIPVACAPEFGGHPGIWSPEDLFVGAVEVCTMTTFLWLAAMKKITIRSYESEARGTAQMSEGALRFTSIHIKVRIGILDEGDRPEIEKILQEISKWCLISKSIDSEVRIEPEIFVAVIREGNNTIL